MDVTIKFNFAIGLKMFIKIMKKLYLHEHLLDDKMWGGMKRIKITQVHTLKVFHEIGVGRKEYFHINILFSNII